MTDEELMERVRVNDLMAFGEIYDRYQPKLFLFLRRIFRDPADAEDIVQESFWRVWNRRETYRSHQPFIPWLFVIARHAALDRLRRSARETRFSDLPESERLRAEDATTAVGSAKTTLESKACDQIEIREALDSLTTDQRMALILKEFHGYSYREIGIMLECTEGGARALAHRARATLRLRLSETADERK